MNELPDYRSPFGIDEGDNYTGPFWSDGKVQTSVPFGEAEVKSKLDALSRLHDTAYATYQDAGHRKAADSIYNKEANKLRGLYPHLAGDLVVYGNHASDALSNLATASSTGLLGLVYGGIKNMYNLNDYMINERKYKKDIEDLYAKDPMLTVQTVPRERMNKYHDANPGSVYVTPKKQIALENAASQAVDRHFQYFSDVKKKRRKHPKRNRVYIYN